MAESKDSWGSRVGLILSMAGNAMGAPCMGSGFMQDEFLWNRKKAAWIFGLVILGLSTVIFFNQGIFDKFITPVLLFFVFLGSLFTPLNSNWSNAFQQLFTGKGWQLDNGSIIKQLSNSSLIDQINKATDLSIKAELQQKLFLINSSRLLLFVFLGVTFLVYKAYHKRKREGRIPI